MSLTSGPLRCASASAAHGGATVVVLQHQQSAGSRTPGRGATLPVWRVALPALRLALCAGASGGGERSSVRQGSLVPLVHAGEEHLVEVHRELEAVLQVPGGAL